MSNWYEVRAIDSSTKKELTVYIKATDSQHAKHRVNKNGKWDRIDSITQIERPPNVKEK